MNPGTSEPDRVPPPSSEDPEAPGPEVVARPAWTLLTNRVHPTRHVDTGIFELRPALSDALIAAFDALS